MKKASIQDKAKVVEILAAAFQDNKSVQFIIKQDGNNHKRICSLMEYAFDRCYREGEIYLSDNEMACALFLLPGKRKSTLLNILTDIKFVLTCSGIENIKKLLTREKSIKALQPSQSFYYLWFIGVYPAVQLKGLGTLFFKELLQHIDCNAASPLICLETSTLKNIPWYQKFGFEVYNSLQLDYQLYFMKRK